MIKNNGFTLIELLAVIVILAIIALIAVPIVINIINDSKTSSDEQSVELYLDTVKKTIAKKQLSNPNFNPDKCEIQSSGNLKCYKANESLGIMEIDMKGTMPEKGIILINNNKYIFKNIKYNNKTYYSLATLLNDSDNNNEISIGDKYTYKVNDTDTFNFYVLSFNEDDTVNLIMDRNICENGTVDYANDLDNNYCRYAWHSGTNDSTYGPDTAMQVLYNATKKWSNVPNMIFNYVDENSSVNGYKDISVNDGISVITSKNEEVIKVLGTAIEPLKARMPKKSEVVSNDNDKICSHTGPCNQCPNWLVDYLDSPSSICGDIYITNSHIGNIVGYWLLSSYFEGGSYYIGNNGNDGADYTNIYDKYGIRPVIKVPIEDLE